MSEAEIRYPSLRAHLIGMLAVFTALFLCLTLYLYSASRTLFSEALSRELSGDIQWMKSILAADPTLIADPARADSLCKAVSGHKSFRVTLVDGKGKVLADSHVPREDLGEVENHNDRPEFTAARLRGSGQAWRYSHTLGTDMLYVAHRLPDGKACLRMAAGPGPLKTFQGAAVLVFALFLGLFLIASLAVLWWISHTISSPLLHLFSNGSGTPRWQAKFREAELLNGAFEGYVQEIRKLAGEVTGERDKLIAVLNQLEEGLVILAADGTVLAANPASQRLLGAPDSLVDRRIGDAGLQGALVEWIAKADDAERIPVLHLDRGPHSPFDLLCRLNSLKTEGADRLHILTILNITEFRHLDRVKSEFVANASHELKTPLSSIKGYAETLLEGALDDRRVRKPFIEKIHGNAQRLERLVQDLLHLSRLESHPVPKQQEPLPLRNYVAAAANLHRDLVDSAGLRFENHVPEDIFLLMEPRDLELILDNLIGNAVRYNKAGGKIKVGLEAGGQDGFLSLYVKDTGFGIPEEMLPRIFERFYRANASRARKDGTGLGLAIVKHAAQKYGMTVRAESVLDVGSRFVVEIPDPIRRKA